MTNKKVSVFHIEFWHDVNFQVSKLGFGYTGFTGIDNSAPVSEELTLSIIKHAFDKGITFFHTNEVLVGKVFCLSSISQRHSMFD